MDLFAPGDNIFSTVMTGCGNADPEAPPVRIDHNRQVTADTYVIAPDGSGYTSLERCAGLSVIYNARAAAYKGHFYTIGVTNSENGGWVFCETELSPKSDAVRAQVATMLMRFSQKVS